MAPKTTREPFRKHAHNACTMQSEHCRFFWCTGRLLAEQKNTITFAPILGRGVSPPAEDTLHHMLLPGPPPPLPTPLLPVAHLYKRSDAFTLNRLCPIRLPLRSTSSTPPPHARASVPMRSWITVPVRCGKPFC